MSVITEQLLHGKSDLMLICAGREGSFSLEDCLCGGMFIARLRDSGAFNLANDAAQAALLLYNHYGESLEQAVRETDHGRYLQKLGFGPDINVATALDTIEVIPVWNEGRLVSLDKL
jgi:2-phosphosulfolactate phosphatase